MREWKMSEEKAKILVIDDEKEMLENYSRLLTRMGYSCTTEGDGEAALRTIESLQPDIVLADLKMPKKDGFEILRFCKDLDPDIVVIMITAYATIENAVKAVKEGAFDFIPKPFSSDQLRIVIDRALTQKRLKEENTNLSRQLKEILGFKNIVGKSPSMQGVFKVMDKVTKTDANVLIIGETGTGKELVARAIHANSRRYAKPFIPIDCASFPEHLLEDELFGHEKGAFTGAYKTRKGLFEVADGGTVFLDEIGDMGIGLQAKLLRVIEERQLRRVGGTRFINVDVRILSATNKDLREAVERGTFRKDLFYRLNVITIHLPPLRDRREDIPLLVDHFIHQCASETGKRVSKVESEVYSILQSYEWPGNVRELKNVIERAITLMDGEVLTPAYLPEYVLQERMKKELVSSTPILNKFSYKEAKERWLATFEKEYLTRLLGEAKGNISLAARKAGLNRRTIYRLMRRYNLTR